MDKNTRTRSASVLLNDFLKLALGISEKTAWSVADQIQKMGELSDMKQHVREIKGDAFTQLNAGLTKLKKQLEGDKPKSDDKEDEVKPDSPDVDGDGDKKEPIKKAAKEKDLKEGSMPTKRVDPDPESPLYKKIKAHPRYHINGYSYFKAKGADDEEILMYWSRKQERDMGPDDWGMPALKAEGYTFINHLLTELDAGEQEQNGVMPDYMGTNDQQLSSRQLQDKRRQMRDPKKKALDKQMQTAGNMQQKLAAENKRHMQAIQAIKKAGA